jgi:hypothetical protein
VQQLRAYVREGDHLTLAIRSDRATSAPGVDLG